MLAWHLVAEYLLSNIEFQHFQERFVALAWPTREGSLEAEVELRLAEFTSGHWTEEELRQHLCRLLAAWTLQPKVELSSTASTATVWWPS